MAKNPPVEQTDVGGPDGDIAEPSSENTISNDERLELEQLRAEKNMRASQTNPDGANYNPVWDDDKQTGTKVEPPHPDNIGYHPHTGDHSLDPVTLLPRE